MDARTPTTTTTAQQRALLTLVLAGGASAAGRRLLQRHGSPLSALQAGRDGWRDAGCDDTQQARLARPDSGAFAAGLRWLDAGHHLIGMHDDDYPALLGHTASPPLALFVAGDPALLWHPAIAIVGTRVPSAGGREHARHFADALASSGMAVVSGMAAGIDAAAHEATLARAGITVAVLGTGPDLAYPARHRDLHRRIIERGAVVSEHPPGTLPRPGHFPARNRIIAGLGLGTVVIEAAERSGALITARLAAEAGREVFALPGSIHNPMTRGCHRLIRDGALLVEHPDEVLASLGALPGSLAQALQQRLGIPIEAPQPDSPHTGDPRPPHYQTLWKALGHDPTPMDSLIERTGLTAAELSAMLLLMELEGNVVAEHGRYTRNH